MFHTPKLTGWKKKYIPRRINEGWGLQHMKLYGFDDEIMLSGCETLYLRLRGSHSNILTQSKSVQRLFHQSA